MKLIKKIIVTGLGTGYLPIAPSTWGSAVISVVFLAVAWFSEFRIHCVSGTMAVAAALSCIGCVALGRFTQEAYGKKDPGACTIDEFAGQSIAYLLLPLGSSLHDLLIVTAVGFFAFRFFDIVKPPPARQLEKLPFGWGVLLDDVAAGIYANIACQLLLRFWLFA